MSLGDQMPNAPPTCARCSKYIYDETIAQVGGRFWHHSCLCCTICNTLITSCCHVMDSQIYCRSDFVRLFGVKCSGCQQVILPFEEVQSMGSNVYHHACFKCVICNKELIPSSNFYRRQDGKTLCSVDCQRLSGIEFDDNVNSDSDESDADDNDPTFSTCLHEKQLCTLTEAYQLNAKPTHSELLKLSREIGVHRRTIDRWFRSRRAKDQYVCCSSLPQGEQSTTKHDSCTYWPNYVVLQQNLNFGKEVSPSIKQTTFTNFDYRELDYLDPNSMPPNVELSSDDIFNGEVIADKAVYRQ